MKQKVPKVCLECIATQLILRSVGFTTSEFSVSITKKGKLNADVDLILHRNDKTEVIELGNVKLAHKTVLSYWESWLETATKQLVDDLRTDKKLFYSLAAYKSMDALFTHLEKQGFDLEETNIATTF